MQVLLKGLLIGSFFSYGGVSFGGTYLKNVVVLPATVLKNENFSEYRLNFLSFSNLLWLSLFVDCLRSVRYPSRDLVNDSPVVILLLVYFQNRCDPLESVAGNAILYLKFENGVFNSGFEFSLSLYCYFHFDCFISSRTIIDFL